MKLNGNAIVRENKDIHRGREPKILYLDLEISPLLMWAYGAYETNALKIKIQPHIVSFAWKWEHEKTIHAKVLPDYPGYRGGITYLNDKHIVRDLHNLIGGADIIVTHNGKQFDIKHARARFIFHKLEVPNKYTVEDTLFIARKYFRFAKNNLDELCELFGIGTKTKIKHSDVIWDCIEGDKKAWEAMRIYNRNDIHLTVELYKRLAPWHETHTNLNIYRRKEHCCPICGCQKVQSRGFSYQMSSIKHRYSCTMCGKWWSEEKIEKEYDKVKQTN